MVHTPSGMISPVSSASGTRLYLPKDFRPPEAYAQWASSTILRDTYLTFALWTSAIAIAMWAIALLISLAGVTGGL